MISYEIPSSWKTKDCTDLCWQRFVQLAPGERRRVLTYHDLDGHEHAWNAARQRDVVTTGPLTIDARRHIASIDGHDVYMTPIEFSILACLGQRVGAVSHSRDVLRQVWGESDAENTQILRVNINRLRARLGPAASLIVTRPAVGYLLRDLEPCTTADLSVAKAPFTPPADWQPVPPPPPMVGEKQFAILRALRAAPGRRLLVEQAATIGWGACTRRSCWGVFESVQNLQRRGYPLSIGLTLPRSQSLLQITGDLPCDEAFA